MGLRLAAITSIAVTSGGVRIGGANDDERDEWDVVCGVGWCERGLDHDQPRMYRRGVECQASRFPIGEEIFDR